MKIFIIIVFIIHLSGFAWAQYDEKNFTTYTVKNGLSDNNINCLQQDAEGYLWIGTDAGLNRFDGNSFKNYYRGTMPLHLPSINISRLKRFGPDKLGILSSGGFLVLNTKNYSVQHFRVPDSTAISIYINSVWDAVELPDKSFTITSAAGFYRFNPKGELLYRHDAYTINDIGQKRILYGRDIFSLSAKKYVVNIDEAGLAFYDDEKKIFSEFRTSEALKKVFSDSPIFTKDYWTVKQQISKDEFVFLRFGFNKITYYNYPLKKTVLSSLPSRITDSINWESKIVPINDSVLAINSATNGFYILKINRKTGAISSDGIKHLPDYKIICLFSDKDQRLWIGTREGLLKQELTQPSLKAWHYPPPGGEKFHGGFSIVYRYKDKLYTGRYSNSKGLAIIDPVTMKLIKEIDFFSASSKWNEVISIETYYPDTLWIGTSAGLIWFDTKTEGYGKVLDEKKYPWAVGFSASLAPARSDGYAWMCSILGGKVVRYHIPTRTFTLFTKQTTPALPFEKVKQIVYDAFGDVWISGHSLVRWNNNKKYFDTLITTYGGDGKFNDNIVVIRADEHGSLWLHNAYNGLSEYRIKEKKFITYTMKDGLPSDLINALSPVMNNKLWAAADSHLYLFDIETRQVTVYDYRDELPDHKPTGRKIYYDEKSGFLYLCSNEYLVRFPFLPKNERDRSSGLFIEEMTAGNQKTWYYPEEPLHFKYNENNISFTFSVIDFEKSNYRFAYRLNNSDNWTAIGNQRNINLNKLPPGRYKLDLKATGKPGIEKIKTFSFTIKPPLWKTGWFIAIVAALLGSLIYFLYRRRISHISKKAELDKQLSQTEMKALQAQMNPHFIFNSLNSIREMILNNENKDASHYLSKFAHLIRITLDQSSQSLVSLRNTIDYLQRYMEMEQIRNDLFTYTIRTDEKLDVDDTFIPPMLIQPFIENGLWHGVAASNKTIHITIHFKKENNKLICMVDDNGIGLNKSQNNKTGNGKLHRPHGISNIQNRIKLLNEKYNLQCEVKIRDKKEIPGTTGSGTEVTISLPLEINKT